MDCFYGSFLCVLGSFLYRMWICVGLLNIIYFWGMPDISDIFFFFFFFFLGGGG